MTRTTSPKPPLGLDTGKHPRPPAQDTCTHKQVSAMGHAPPATPQGQRVLDHQVFPHSERA